MVDNSTCEASHLGADLWKLSCPQVNLCQILELEICSTFLLVVKILMRSDDVSCHLETGVFVQ